VTVSRLSRLQHRILAWLLAEGLSTQAITTRLNREGVLTLSGRGQWQRGTVANLRAQED